MKNLAPQSVDSGKPPVSPFRPAAREAARAAIKEDMAHQFEIIDEGAEGHRLVVRYRRNVDGPEFSYRSGLFLRDTPARIRAEAERKLKRMGASAEQIVQLITV